MGTTTFPKAHLTILVLNSNPIQIRRKPLTSTHRNVAL